MGPRMVSKQGKMGPGARLRAERARRGQTQLQVAEVLGTTRNTVARWERGEMGISSIAARAIERYLVSLDHAARDPAG